MMDLIGIGAASGAGVTCLAILVRSVRARRTVLARLHEPESSDESGPRFESSARRSPIGLNRAPSIGLATGFSVLALSRLGLSVPVEFALSWSFIAGALAYVIADIQAGRVIHRLESQLADAMDLMVSSLRAGAGWSDALATATSEVRRPLRPLLENALGRLRYGESPAVVLADLSDRVPLDSFWLFSLTQQVQQGAGGSVAKGLAAVSRFVRDRVEQRRMTATQSTMARVSMLFVTLLTYLIAAVIWFNNPVRAELFLEGPIGRSLAAGAMALQAVGVLWITRLSRVRD